MTLSLYAQFENLKNKLTEKTCFVTGTDTDVGKSVFTWQFVQFLREQGEKVIILKPAECGDVGDKDSDFYESRLGAGSCVCPYSFDRPVSPHFEARRTGRVIEFAHIMFEYHRLRNQFDWVIVEGAGGVFCPLSDTTFILDLMADMKLPALVVARNRVGCLNHTLLTLAALTARSIPITGVVVNGDENQDNINDIPLLSKQEVVAVLPWKPEWESTTSFFRP